MTKEEKQKAIDALKISVPIKALTQEEFNDYIQTLNKIMDWLEQEPTTKNDLGVDAVSRKDVHDMLENLPVAVEDKWFNWLQKACMRLAELPPVTPQEPCKDVVSRSEIKRIAKEMYLEVANMEFDAKTISDCISYTSSKCREVLERKLQALPSVTPQEPRWIPVTERLPEEKTAVLLSCDDMYLAKLNPCIGWISGNNWYTFSARGSYLVKYPIAWMSLPEPYKAESEGKKDKIMKIKFITDFARNWKAGEIVEAKILSNGDTLVDNVVCIDTALLMEHCIVVEIEEEL